MAEPARPVVTKESAQRQFEVLYPLLQALYPVPRCGLNFENPFQLLVATILSAQCTDERVNKITPDLFERFPDAYAMSEADPVELEKLIYTAGFYHNKAKSILGASKMIVEKYGGHVPDNMPDLLKLPGVARKTASVVLGNAYGKNEGIAVDTHVTRLVGRLGLSSATTPEKIEQDLMELTPREEWTDVSHRLIWHGRLVCEARNPKCAICKLAPHCPSNRFKP
ncbi:MAG TPA: endonuclease III [Chloroflexia bacterium]|nr:endonuclease III [Chloroflexia bacterium]